MRARIGVMAYPLEADMTWDGVPAYWWEGPVPRCQSCGVELTIRPKSRRALVYHNGYTIAGVVCPSCDRTYPVEEV